MGNDGGSIPKRRELVKEAAKNPSALQIKEKQHEQQEYFWTTDPLSRKPLAEPIVSDSNGKLYNKDSILEHLLEAGSLDAAVAAEAEEVLQGAVKSLKDVVELHFHVSESDTSKQAWTCPVTNATLGPGTKAAYLVPCGHVFAAQAVKEIAGDKCLVCESAYAENDVIPILSTSKEDIARLTLRTKTLKESGLSHSLKKTSKKEKKGKKRDREEEEAAATVPGDGNGGKEAQGYSNGVKGDAMSSVVQNGAATKTNRSAARPKELTNGAINNSSTRSLTEKVLAEEERKKRLKLNNANVQSLFSSRDQSKPIGKSSDFMTRGYDIPAGAKR